MNKKTLTITSIILLLSTIVMSILFWIAKKNANWYSEWMVVYAEWMVDAFDFIECILDADAGLIAPTTCNVFFDKLEVPYAWLHEAGLYWNYILKD